MKDIKSYIIGFLCCACMFLFMGQTSNDDAIDKAMDDAMQLLEIALGLGFIKTGIRSKDGKPVGYEMEKNLG